MRGIMTAAAQRKFIQSKSADGKIAACSRSRDSGRVILEMALTFEQCRSCGGRTQIDTRVPPEDRRCMLCGGSCSEAKAMDEMDIPSGKAEVTRQAHRPAELVAANCPHCEADI